MKFIKEGLTHIKNKAEILMCNIKSDEEFYKMEEILEEKGFRLGFGYNERKDFIFVRLFTKKVSYGTSGFDSDLYKSVDEINKFISDNYKHLDDEGEIFFISDYHELENFFKPLTIDNYFNKLKSYESFINESLLDKISGPSEEEIRKHIDSITDINKKLSIAIKNDLLDVVEDIVNNGNYNEELSIRDACYYNKPDLVYYLLNNNDIYNIKNIKAINLVLIQSSEHGIFELVKFSLEHGADVNYGRSYSLRYAIMNNHMDIAKYLIKHGADVELADSFIIKYKKFDDSKKLHDLVNLKESLLDKISGPSEEEIISNLSKNPNKLLLYACSEGLIEYVEKSLEYGADIHFKKDLAIKTVAECGYLDIVKYLISKGADFHIEAETPLRYASFSGHLDIVKYLVEHGANIKAKSGDVLENAIINGHIDIVKYLVEKGIDVSKNKRFLDLAATNGNYEIVKYLVEHGADIYNKNAIYIAKSDKYYKIVIYLEAQIKKHIRQDFLSGKFGKYTMSLMDFKKYCSENEIEYLTDEEILLYKINYSNKHGDMEVKMDEILKIALRKDYKQIIDYFLNHPKEIDVEDRKEIYYYFIKNGDLEMVKKLVDSGKIKFTNNSYFVDLRFILYGYLVNRKIDMFLYIFKFYKKYTRWEIEWLYDMVNDKQTMGYKNNKEKMEIYKPVIDLLKKTLDELK